MTTQVIETEFDRARLGQLIAAQALPFTVNITKGKGKKRSLDQNALQRKWLGEIAEQLPQDTVEGWRGYCKLRFGVPIMRAESEKFAEAYDRLIRPRSYEEKIELMMLPMDMPVTRLLTTKQHSVYLDAIHKHFTEQGVILTMPKAKAA